MTLFLDPVQALFQVGLIPDQVPQPLAQAAVLFR